MMKSWVVEDDAADDAEGSDADEAAEGGDDDAAADAVGRAELDHVESEHPYDTLPEIEPPRLRARGRGLATEAQRCTAGAVVRFLVMPSDSEKEQYTIGKHFKK